MLDDSETSIGVVVELERLSKSALEKLAQLSSSTAEAETTGAHSQGFPASNATGTAASVDVAQAISN